MHKHWNASQYHSFSAFSCKDGDHFTMGVGNGVQRYHVWFAWFGEDVHLDVTTGSAMKEFIVKTNWEDCKISHIFRSCRSKSVADFEEVYMLITYQDQGPKTMKIDPSDCQKGHQVKLNLDYLSINKSRRAIASLSGSIVLRE